MAGTTGDVVQLTLVQEYLDQQVLNVHFYILDDTPTDTYLEGLCNEFVETVLPAYAAAQSGDLTYIELRALNIFSADEFVLAPLSITEGDVTGASLASFIAASIKLVRSNARVRHGRKAIAGMTEENAVQQEWTTTIVDLLQDLGDALASTLTAGLSDVFKPVIVGRVFVPADPPDVPRAFYRLPESQVEMDDNWAYVISGLPSTHVTSENSRKLGHGI